MVCPGLGLESVHPRCKGRHDDVAHCNNSDCAGKDFCVTTCASCKDFVAFAAAHAKNWLEKFCILHGIQAASDNLWQAFGKDRNERTFKAAFNGMNEFDVKSLVGETHKLYIEDRLILWKIVQALRASESDWIDRIAAKHKVYLPPELKNVLTDNGITQDIFYSALTEADCKSLDNAPVACKIVLWQLVKLETGRSNEVEKLREENIKLKNENDQLKAELQSKS